MLKRMTFVRWSRPGGEGALRQIQPPSVITGLVWAIAVMLFCGVMLALWVTVSAGTIYHLSGVLSICMLLAALIGGGMSGVNARQQGWLNGGTVGFIYGVLFLMIIGGGGLGSVSDPLILARLPVLTAAGILGGIIGVNWPVRRLRNRQRVKEPSPWHGLVDRGKGRH